MGFRRYPPLKPAEVVSILHALKFEFKRKDGSHAQYEKQIQDGKRRVVTVDEAEREFDDYLMKSMIKQSGHDRKEFYGATKKTAKKIR